MKNEKDVAAYDYRGMKWKAVEEPLAIFPDGAILIKEDTLAEVPRAIMALPRKHPTGAAIQRRAAKIVAAAPELLTALEDLVKIFDPDKQSIYNFARKQIERAREVIDKATKNE